MSFCYWVWQDQVIHQSRKNYDFNDYIFAISTEVNGNNPTQPEHEDEFKENYMTVYVKTISGKTIRIKCDITNAAATRTAKTVSGSSTSNNMKERNGSKTTRGSKDLCGDTTEKTMKMEQRKANTSRLSCYRKLEINALK